VNNTPNCLDPLMRAARVQWGFETNGGYVTSDTDSVADAWDAHDYARTAANASCLAITAGADQIDSGGTFEAGLLEGVKQGLCKMSDVDAALEVVMKMRMELGLFDPVDGQPMLKYGAEDMGTKEADELNLLATQRSLVLLKDGAAGGSVLPLKIGTSTAVLGPHYNASWVMVQPDAGDACPSGGIDCIPTPIGEITRFNKGGKTVGALGSYLLVDSNTQRAESLLAAAVAAAKAATQVVLMLGIRSGGYGLFQCDRPRRPGHETAVCKACNCTLGAMAPFTDPDGPYGAVPDVHCSTGACKHGAKVRSGDEYIEAETHDRTSIDLPAVQHTLAMEIIALGKPTVIVLLNGGSVAVAEEMKAPNVAIVEAFYPGTKGSESIAGAIFASSAEGKYIDRWGRLPYSVYPKHWVNLSKMDEMDLAAYPGRTYRYSQTEPLFDFAHGLQLAQFELKLEAAPTSLSAAAVQPHVYELSLRNLPHSPHAAECIVVAFLVPVSLPHPHPLKKQMIGFQRQTTPLQPGGAAVKLTFSFSAADLSITDPVTGDRILEPGSYSLLFSTGSEGAGATANTTLTIEGDRSVLQKFPSVEESTPTAVAPPAAAAAPVDAPACSGSACPTWPSAVHLEGTLFITTTASSSSANATVTGEGTAVWQTVGDVGKPGSSLSYTRRFESMSMPGEPASDATNSTTELWQICPQHKQYRNVTSSLMPSGCGSLPQPCFHRYDPVSLALAACKSWVKRADDTSDHFAGTRCDFAGFHIPGQTGTFDVYYEGGKVVKFETNTTTTTNPAVRTLTSETVEVTSYSESPDPAVFRRYCKPS
jgi:hypothetical protein